MCAYSASDTKKERRRKKYLCHLSPVTSHLTTFLCILSCYEIHVQMFQVTISISLWKRKIIKKIFISVIVICYPLNISIYEIMCNDIIIQNINWDSFGISQNVFFSIKRGPATSRTAPILCGIFCVSGPPWAHLTKI